MSFKLKSVIAAVAMGLAAAAAQATPATVLVADEAWSFAGFSDDYFSFSIATPGTYTLDMGAVAVGSNFINELRLYEGPGLFKWLDAVVGPEKSLSWTFDVSGPGLYSLYVDVSKSGLYAGAIAAATTAVPEPETYAMMIAGLGAIGFMARRRKSTTAV